MQAPPEAEERLTVFSLDHTTRQRLRDFAPLVRDRVAEIADAVWARFGRIESFANLRARVLKDETGLVAGDRWMRPFDCIYDQDYFSRAAQCGEILYRRGVPAYVFRAVQCFAGGRIVELAFGHCKDRRELLALVLAIERALGNDTDAVISGYADARWRAASEEAFWL